MSIMNLKRIFILIMMKLRYYNYLKIQKEIESINNDTKESLKKSEDEVNDRIFKAETDFETNVIHYFMQKHNHLVNFHNKLN